MLRGRLEQRVESVFNEFGSRFQYVAQLSNFLLLKRPDSQDAGDEEAAGH